MASRGESSCDTRAATAADEDVSLEGLHGEMTWVVEWKVAATLPPLSVSKLLIRQELQDDELLSSNRFSL
jgi:hypothetical protein